MPIQLSLEALCPAESSSVVAVKHAVEKIPLPAKDSDEEIAAADLPRCWVLVAVEVSRTPKRSIMTIWDLSTESGIVKSLKKFARHMPIGG